MIVTLPLYIELPRKRGKAKRIYLTYNAIKNVHHMVYNDIKHQCQDIIRDQLSESNATHLKTPVKITCYLYVSGEREQDLDNTFSAVKFASDAVVNLGYLYDDSYKYVKEIRYLFGGKDKFNPRYEIHFEEL